MVAEGAQLLVALLRVDLQQRCPGDGTVAIEQRPGEALEVGRVERVAVLDEAAHAVEVAQALLQALLQAAEALGGEVLELLAAQVAGILQDLAAELGGEGEAGEDQQAAQQPLAAPAEWAEGRTDTGRGHQGKSSWRR